MCIADRIWINQAKSAQVPLVCRKLIFTSKTVTFASTHLADNEAFVHQCHIRSADITRVGFHVLVLHYRCQSLHATPATESALMLHRLQRQSIGGIRTFLTHPQLGQSSATVEHLCGRCRHAFWCIADVVQASVVVGHDGELRTTGPIHRRLGLLMGKR